MTVAQNMALEAYKTLEPILGEEVKVTPTITKRECTEQGWTYTFLFDKGNLKKVEAFNGRELIETWL